MNWLHACYCFGAMLGPLLMTAVLSAGRPYAAGYAAVGAVLGALALVFLATRPRWGAASADPAGAAPVVRTRDALAHPAVLLHMAVFFVYTGLEVAIGQWAFTVLTEDRGVARESAGVAVGAYWGSIGVGRVVSGLVAERVGLDRLVRACLLAAAVGAGLFAAPLPAWCAFAGLVVAGAGLAPVYPCLMTRTPQRLGPGLSAHAIGFQVGAAMIGAAAIPAGLGLLAGGVGLSAVPIAAAALAAGLWLLHEALVRGGAPELRPGGRA